MKLGRKNVHSELPGERTLFMGVITSFTRLSCAHHQHTHASAAASPCMEQLWHMLHSAGARSGGRGMQAEGWVACVYMQQQPHRPPWHASQ